MKMIPLPTYLPACAILAVSLGAAGAQTISNPSFESLSAGSDPIGGRVWNDDPGAGPAVINLPDWSITRMSYVNNADPAKQGLPYYPSVYHTGSSTYGTTIPEDGSFFITVYGAGIYDTMTTTVEGTATGLVSGQTYEVNFWYAAEIEENPSFPPIVPNQNTWSLTAGGSNVTVDAMVGQTLVSNATNPSIPAGFPHQVGPWKEGSLTFTASGTSTLLSFVGVMSGGPTQLMLDNITIALVPEPSGISLLGLIGMLGLLRRRR